MKVTISEARLNDIVYLTLKKFFFEGMGRNPRECDIRVCMMMVAPPIRTGTIADAILLPNEVAPRSHTAMYEIETDAIFDECVDYLEDHWMKQTFAKATGDADAEPKMKEFFGEIVKACMAVPEEQCAVDGQ